MQFNMIRNSQFRPTKATPYTEQKKQKLKAFF